MCWSAFAAHPIASCVDDFLRCAQTNDPSRNQATQANLAKSRIGTVLALGVNTPRLTAGLRLAEAAEQDFWDWNHPAFAPIIAFMKTVARL